MRNKETTLGQRTASGCSQCLFSAMGSRAGTNVSPLIFRSRLSSFPKEDLKAFPHHQGLQVHS